MIDPRPILPEDVVRVFDVRLYKDDRKTPKSLTMQRAVVLRRYGMQSERYGIYPDLVDVRFERDGFVSHGHFTYAVEMV